MRVHRTLFIARCKTPVVFRLIKQSLHALTEVVEGTRKGTGPLCMLLARDGEADTGATQVLSNLVILKPP